MHTQQLQHDQTRHSSIAEIIRVAPSFDAPGDTTDGPMHPPTPRRHACGRTHVIAVYCLAENLNVLHIRFCIHLC